MGVRVASAGGGTRAIDASGNQSAGAFYRVFQQVGPNPYAAGGIPIDLSAIFANSLIAVSVIRSFVTATNAFDGRRFVVNQTGTDTFANRKCRLVGQRGQTAVGTNGAPGVTTDPDVVSNPGGALSGQNVWAGAQTGSGTCVATCSNNHPGLNPSATQRVLSVGAAGAPNKVTAVLTVAAPVFTGTAPTIIGTELGAIDLSAITLELLCLGT